MGKPGSREIFESDPMTIDEWVTGMHYAVDAFADNMRRLELGLLTDFEWFYTFGFWNESLEFRDEYPGYFEEYKELGDLMKDLDELTDPNS